MPWTAGQDSANIEAHYVNHKIGIRMVIQSRIVIVGRMAVLENVAKALRDIGHHVGRFAFPAGEGELLVATKTRTHSTEGRELWPKRTY